MPREAGKLPACLFPASRGGKLPACLSPVVPGTGLPARGALAVSETSSGRAPLLVCRKRDIQTFERLGESGIRPTIYLGFQVKPEIYCISGDCSCLTDIEHEIMPDGCLNNKGTCHEDVGNRRTLFYGVARFRSQSCVGRVGCLRKRCEGRCRIRLPQASWGEAALTACCIGGHYERAWNVKASIAICASPNWAGEQGCAACNRIEA